MLLTFLIPAYRRRNGVERAALSVLQQCTLSTKGLVSLWVNDDCSPNEDISWLANSLQKYSSVADISVTQNSRNLGMSRNIYYMVRNVYSAYWTVLTDDDMLLPNSLLPILELMQAASVIELTSIVTMRYCYSEIGEFLFKDAVNGTDYPRIIRPGAGAAMRYIQNAHVLTGLIMQSGLDLAVWEQNIDNAYFPMLNYSSSLFTGFCLTIDKPWFRHTVFNPTFWDEWGDSDIAITKRINFDYLSTLALAMEYSLSKSKTFKESCLALFYYCKYASSTLGTFLSRSRVLYVIRLVMSVRGSSTLTMYLMLLCLMWTLILKLIESPCHFARPFVQKILSLQEKPSK